MAGLPSELLYRSLSTEGFPTRGYFIRGYSIGGYLTGGCFTGRYSQEVYLTRALTVSTAQVVCCRCCGHVVGHPSKLVLVIAID